MVVCVPAFFTYGNNGFVVRNGNGLEIAHTGGVVAFVQKRQHNGFRTFDEFVFFVDFSNVKGSSEACDVGI